jgi:WD40 repeat protein
MDRTIIIWDRDTREIVNTLEGFDNAVVDIIELESSKLILNCHESFFLIWEWESESANNLTALEDHEEPVTVIVKSGRKVLTGSQDGTIKKWNPERDTYPEFTYNGHTAPVIAIENLDSKHFASTSLDLTIRVWSVLKDKCMKTFQTSDA